MVVRVVVLGDVGFEDPERLLVAVTALTLLRFVGLWVTEVDFLRLDGIVEGWLERVTTRVLLLLLLERPYFTDRTGWGTEAGPARAIRAGARFGRDNVGKMTERSARRMGMGASIVPAAWKDSSWTGRHVGAA